MPDTIPASTSTSATIGIGGTVTGTVDFKEDHDWYAISLTAGQSITITLGGLATSEGSLEDPYLNLRSSTGAILAWNDDSGGNRNAKVVFTATTTGTYYIDAGAWDRSSDSPTPLPSDPNYDPTYTGIGTYTLRVNTYEAPPLWSYDQIANQLVNGYWASTGESSRHFNVTQGGTITVNFGALSASERNLANAALTQWSDIIGVTFTTVTSGGQIVFDNTEDPSDPGPTAYSEGHFSGGVYTSADVRISTSWVNQYGTGLNSYSFQTYLHEIGHALGLGHAGNYNGNADYAADALYRNDAWSNSIMSYFDPRTDNTYFKGLGFTYQYTVTPMNGDIVAMQQMYGLSTTTRAGDTTYGFNSTAVRAVYNAASMPDVAYTVFDSGGNDTLDYSGFTQNQLINLTAETFSNVGSGVGNVMIARGTVIENAIGGSGSDHINGNAAANRLVGNGGTDYISGGDGNDFLTGGLGNDELMGGAGNDTFIDTRSSLNTDEIMDFSTGDRIVFTDATLSNFSFNFNGITLNYTGGSMTLSNVWPGSTFIASAAAEGGVQLAFAVPPRDADHDFNGDGISDLMWRNQGGTLSEWLGTTSGGFQWNSVAGFTVGTDWSIQGFGDFNGDSRDDILWRQNGTGTVMQWLAQANGSFAWNVNYSLATNQQFAGIGDFNGDNRDDILWRDASGTLSEWLGQTSGGFQWNPYGSFQAGIDWAVVGTGDFNHDGRDDLIWRQGSTGKVMEWLGQSNGGFAWNLTQDLSTSFHLAGVADFNGDGFDDLLWRDLNGTLSEWLGQTNGGFQWNANAAFQVSNTWQVASTGDFNRDGRDDIIWKTDTGQTFEWLGQANGGFVWHQAVQYDVGANVQAQPPSDHFL